jgi:hypothetical protein
VPGQGPDGRRTDPSQHDPERAVTARQQNLAGRYRW